LRQIPDGIIVKQIDYTRPYPPLEDHVGWRLWRLSELWKSQFDGAMVKTGHEWFAEARGNVARHLGPRGLPQSKLALRMGLTKQAVQQLLDELVRDGVVERKPDPHDKRGKLIILTQEGLRALHDANRIKKRIEKDYEKLIGPRKFGVLIETLEELAAALKERKTGQ
jgi:DNA-binding MarR family transcriptional regulator